MNLVNNMASNTNNVAFTGKTNWRNEYKLLKKALKNASTDTEKLNISKQMEELSKRAGDAAEKRVQSSPFETKFDNAAEKFFSGLFKISNKLTKKLTNKLDKGEAVDIAKKATSIVLLGNTGKEAVGTTLYTIQAMTNEDLPKDKRKFVGMYDLFVGIVSTTVSLLFGVGLQSSISKGYGKLFKPLKSLPQTALITTALAGFSSFVLQTIVGKRILAPAIATPLAGKVKQNMAEKDAAKKQANTATQKTFSTVAESPLAAQMRKSVMERNEAVKQAEVDKSKKTSQTVA